MALLQKVMHRKYWIRLVGYNIVTGALLVSEINLMSVVETASLSRHAEKQKIFHHRGTESTEKNPLLLTVPQAQLTIQNSVPSVPLW